MVMLTQLKNLVIDRVDMDEALSLIVFGKQLAAEYGGHGIEPPMWLTEALEELDREIARRRRDELRRMLKEAKLRREGLKTVDEKRQELDDRIGRLEAQISGASGAAGADETPAQG